MLWQKLPLPSTLRLLIVEAVMADVALVVLALEAAEINLTYDTADNRTTCWQLLQEKNFDAVLTDYHLPGLNGLQVLELVKQSGQEIPAILVTSALGEEAAVESIKAGMTDFVLKEQLFRLPTVLERALQEFALRDQLIKERTKKLEQEKLLSEAANRAKSEFLANISHELRTPLSGILGFSSLLLEQPVGPLNAKQKQYVEGIASGGKHLLELINDLLDVSKIEAGREELTLEKISVEDVCYACLSLIQERASCKGLQLLLYIAPGVTTCIADQRRLKQILFNLLSNAVKFTESGSITLRVEQTAFVSKFSVIDTGIGIAETDRATLFQPFQQLDSGLNRKYEGTGLGLALSRQLARLHGGDITLDSEQKRGSCFTLHLPTQPSS